MPTAMREHIPFCRFMLPDGETLSAVDLAALLAERTAPLPSCLRIVLENVCRQVATGMAKPALAQEIATWTGKSPSLSVPLLVSRLIMPDSSGLPVLMDLAAARDAASAAGASADAVEPRVPISLVIDHSLIVDAAGSADARARNIAEEYRRNAERYSFFKWAQQAFSNLRVVPPGAGIIHQVHLEKLAMLVDRVDVPGQGSVAAPEFVLGCDSHTPMVNGMGLLAWGVGGIEGEAAALGQRHVARIPRVVGVRLSGRLPAGATTTDMVLTITERLRKVGVVGDFVEFFGEGVAAMSVPERATVANMAPEYGATIGYFPIDAKVIDYLRQSGRREAHVAMVEAYARTTGLFVEDHAIEADYSEIVDIDLGAIVASVAGPKRPQDRVALTDIKRSFTEALAAPVADGGFELAPEKRDIAVAVDGMDAPLRNGSIVIAAITSCTNTSNPAVMLAAGLLARNAVRKGLATPGWVKTSMAPGSRLVEDYLRSTGLLESLETLGFHVVGFGCTTCSGKSGPIAPALAETIAANDLVAAAVLSGNRNFEGRIHRSCRANYLASPPLVVAFALAGRVDIDFEAEALGTDADGQPVYLRDIWPAPDELAVLMRETVTPVQFRQSYATLFDGTDLWQRLETQSGRRFAWDPASTYVCPPPFFDTAAVPLPDTLANARVLLKTGDSLTTDHITPSGEISPASLAGRYLLDRGVEQRDFNAVTQRRGNHEFMARITFANQRLKNLLTPGIEGGFTRTAPDADPVPIYEAAQAFERAGSPAIVLAGRDYGMGSSRDWAAKGPKLLGVRAVLAESYERIHRSNLIGVGIVPLVFENGDTAASLGLTGFEVFRFGNLHAAVSTGEAVSVEATPDNGAPRRFQARVDVSGDVERDLLFSGGMFAALLGRLEEAA